MKLTDAIKFVADHQRWGPKETDRWLVDQARLVLHVEDEGGHPDFAVRRGQGSPEHYEAYVTVLQATPEQLDAAFAELD